MFKSRGKFWLVIAAATALMAGRVDRSMAGTLTIENGDFEALTLLDGTSGPSGNIQGWIGAGSYGVWNPSSAVFNQDYGGGNVVWINSGYISQVLPYYLTAGHQYALTVNVGYQNNCITCTSWGYTIELLAGGDSLNAYSGTGKAGEWDTASLNYFASADGGPLEIRLHTDGKRSHFDNVSLSNTAVPEPATFMLLGSGLLGLAGFGRRKMQVL